jgi:murein DD-endopeptidase MepM/ murein hydrolase activator NlpD
MPGIIRPVRRLQSGSQGRITQPFAGSYSGERPGYIRTDTTVACGKRTSFSGSRYKVDFHGGIDYSCASGTSVYAVRDGVIVAQGRYDYTGEYYVILRIKRSLKYQLVAEYTHLLPGSFRFKVGAKVSQGQVIALSGNSGWSTAPHLHFELRRGYRWESPSFINSYRWMKFDPQPFINGRALSTIV